MGKLVYTHAVTADLDELAVKMRQADKDELWAAGGGDVRECLGEAVSWSISPTAARAEADGSLLCVYGLVPASPLGDVGIPWLLGTDVLFDHAFTLTKGTRAWIELVRRSYPRLFNFVDARNTLSIDWLRLVGFTIHAPEPRGPRGMPFHRFDMGF